MLNSFCTKIVIVNLLLLTVSTVALAAPEPTQSQYFNTSGGGIALIPSQSDNTSYIPKYVLTLELRQSIPLGAVAVATFENPANINKPLSTTYTFSTNKDRISLMSPNLSCVTNGKNYRTTVTLYASAKRSRILGTHEQVVNFTIAPAQIQQLNVRLPECKK